jgi:hypothetical protein
MGLAIGLLAGLYPKKKNHIHSSSLARLQVSLSMYGNEINDNKFAVPSRTIGIASGPIPRVFVAPPATTTITTLNPLPPQYTGLVPANTSFQLADVAPQYNGTTFTVYTEPVPAVAPTPIPPCTAVSPPWLEFIGIQPSDSPSLTFPARYRHGYNWSTLAGWNVILNASTWFPHPENTPIITEMGTSTNLNISLYNTTAPFYVTDAASLAMQQLRFVVVPANPLLWRGVSMYLNPVCS